ncbi:MAG: GTPase SAR1 family protein [Alteromonadaceae bacterium]
MYSLHEAKDRLESLIKTLSDTDMNEAQTRFHILDILIKECLNWDGSIEIEKYETANGFTDFELGTPRKVVVEAKREGISFDIPAGISSKLTIPIKTLLLGNQPLIEAIEQVTSYCSNRGVPIAVVTNGHQFVIFLASRVDGINVTDGKALVFTSLMHLYENFTDAWNCISKDGINDNRLVRLLTIGDTRLPRKLSSHLQNYPFVRYASEIQGTLRQLSELFIQDVIDNIDVEKDFYKQCYCDSGVLNRYALLSKNILEARYAAIFSSSEKQPIIVPVKTRNSINFDPSVMAEAMSRRPIVLLGDVGVGKTSFVKNLLHNSAFTEFKNAIYIYIDLGSNAALDTDVNNLVLEQVKSQLFEIYKVDINKSDFVQKVYKDEIARFEDSLWGSYKKSNPEKYQDKLIESLFELQENKSNHIRRSVEYLSRSRQKQPIICIDNADQRDFEVQQNAFIISQELAKEWKATVFLAVRPQTFYKSKRSGALNAYPHKVFTIAPPRVEDVVSKRLVFASRLARGKKTNVDFGNVTSENLAVFLDVLIRSIQSNNEINEFLTNITGGNIRSIIEFVTSFIGSPNVEAEKIIDIEELQGGYQIPLHEFTKQAILGDFAHYNPETSISMNILDVSSADPREHFLVPIAISFLDHKGDHLNKDGFCNTSILIQELQNLGFMEGQIEGALRRATNKKLIETSLRVTFEEDDDKILFGDMPDSFRVTTIGGYHVKRWLGDFAYLDAMLFDTPIFDQDIRDRISINLQSFNIGHRLERANLFKQYLLKIWSSFSMAPAYFNFNDSCTQSQESFRRVRNAVQKINHR